jgi:hypothetical protein
MALIDANLEPSQSQLKWFGPILIAFFAIVSGLLFQVGDAVVAAMVVAGLGAVLVALYWAVRPLRLPVFRLWMRAVYPIGWFVSHLLLGIIYYLVLTPTGLALRLFGHDPMKREFDRDAVSYWLPREPATDSERYFKQS